MRIKIRFLAALLSAAVILAGMPVTAYAGVSDAEDCFLSAPVEAETEAELYPETESETEDAVQIESAEYQGAQVNASEEDPEAETDAAAAETPETAVPETAVSETAAADTPDITAAESDESGAETIVLASPEVTPENAEGGVLLRWNAVDGAARYRVYYRLADGTDKWHFAVNTPSLYYTVQGLASGSAYDFAVRALSADRTAESDFIEKTITYLAVPEITEMTSAQAGILLRWNAVPGAERYRVYYRIADGTDTWHFSVNTGSTYYTVRNLTSGTNYEFAVRALRSHNTEKSAFRYVSSKYIAPPAVTLTNAESGIAVSWGAVSGAARYRVYYREAGSTGRWTVAVNTTATRFTLQGLTSGKTYEIAVRAIASDGVTTGSYIARTKQYIAAPEVSFEADAAGSITVKWNAVAGTHHYNVYHHAEGTVGWTLVSETSATRYRLSGLAEGTRHYFIVRAVSAGGSWSAPVSRECDCLAAPQVQITVNEYGFEIRWDTVKLASRYQVRWRESGESSWHIPATIRGARCPLVGLDWGKTYEIAIVAVSAAGSESPVEVHRIALDASAVWPQASAVLDQIGRDLHAALNWAAGCNYVAMSTTLSSREYADFTFTNHAGNCYGMAAAFYEMARALGYEAHQMSGAVPLGRGGMGPHSWVEVIIDGTTYVCDPDFQHETGRNGFMIHYGQSGTWRYSSYSRMN